MTPGGTTRFADILVVGGGCYGTFYVSQLLTARDRGKLAFDRLTAVDHDPQCQLRRQLGPAANDILVTAEWGAFFDEYLGAQADHPSAPTVPSVPTVPPVPTVPSVPSVPSSPSAIVPSPLMPHLMYEWLERRARARWPGRSVGRAPIPAPLGTPYETVAPDGTAYVSFADWLCPVHCIEPAICPVISAPRTWEMTDALTALTARLARSRHTRGPAMFHCRHQVFGVGMFTVPEVLACDALVAEAGNSEDAVDVLVGTVSACHGAACLLRLGPS